MNRLPSQQRRCDRPAIDQKAIIAPDRCMPRMEFEIDLPNLQHTNILWQNRVQAALECRRIQL